MFERRVGDTVIVKSAFKVWFGIGIGVRVRAHLFCRGQRGIALCQLHLHRREAAAHASYLLLRRLGGSAGGDQSILVHLLLRPQLTGLLARSLQVDHQLIKLRAVGDLRLGVRMLRFHLRLQPRQLVSQVDSHRPRLSCLGLCTLARLLRFSESVSERASSL